jgi:heme-degrading monooxygenase HmoA
MYVRMYTLAGDPARLVAATTYLEDKVRPEVEAQLGSRGMAVASKADVGVCLVSTYWDSADAMAASQRAVAVPPKQLTDVMNGTVAAEEYEVPVFIRQTRPGPGAGVRLTRVDGEPSQMSEAVEEFRHRVGPALLDMPGLCSAQFLVERGTGHCVVISTWEDMDLMASIRSQAAALRADVAALTRAQVRSVEEYMLNFSTVREGDNISLIEREITLWNERDQAGWLALADLNKLEFTAPGGLQLSGRAAADVLWSTWNDAFPDNRLTTVSRHADDRGGVFEGRFVGTHSGYLRGPAGDIGPTGRMVDARFAVVHECNDGKITSTHLYYDQADLLAQLGVPADPAGLS